MRESVDCDKKHKISFRIKASQIKLKNYHKLYKEMSKILIGSTDQLASLQTKNCGMICVGFIQNVDHILTVLQETLNQFESLKTKKVEQLKA